ncbi:unnamed protein product [Allacma fusca]|uniref:Uncharacterized protein n=1 Tax=Allacma fusca TaxID=39272 RepID=A0A8J2P5Z3_9HEXA|nr:unnamed protein product [Allacma fusca]
MCRTISVVEKKLLNNTRPEKKTIKSKIKYGIFLGIPMVVYTFMIMTSIMDVSGTGLKLANYRRLESVLFADNQVVIIVLVFLGKVLVRCTIITVFVQVIGGGMWLTECHNQLAKAIDLKSNCLSRFGMRASSCGCDKNQSLKTIQSIECKIAFMEFHDMTVEEYWDLIKNLKMAYEFYTKLAGCYFLEIITPSVVTTTVGLSLFLENPSRVENLSLVFIGLVPILASTTLGEFMQKNVCYFLFM